MATACVILAGGRASRMGGGDKCLLRVGDRTILERALERIAPSVAEVAINAGGDPVRFRAVGFDGPLAPDLRSDRLGPLAGVEAGLAWARGRGYDAVVTISGDAPFPPADLAPRLTAAARPLACAQSADAAGDLRDHPTFGHWPVALLDALSAALDAGTRKIVAWTEPQGLGRAAWSSEPIDPFFNVNTPDDLAEAERASARALA